MTQVNDAGLCNHNDWRLPGREELRSIVDYSVPSPRLTIDTDWFQNTSNTYYWSASPYASNSGSAWRLNFRNGSYNPSNSGNARQVRLVRGGQ